MGEQPIPKRATVFHASHGNYLRGGLIDRNKVMALPHHSLEYLGTSTIHYTLNRDAPDFPELVYGKREIYTPDEVLAHLQPGDLKVPMVLRVDMEAQGTPLPRSGLLHALHRYVGAQTDIERRLMDDLALLTLGMLVETMVKLLVTPEMAQAYTGEEEDTTPAVGYQRLVVQLLDDDVEADQVSEEDIPLRLEAEPRAEREVDQPTKGTSQDDQTPRSGTPRAATPQVEPTQPEPTQTEPSQPRQRRERVKKRVKKRVEKRVEKPKKKRRQGFA